jgi:hypothetical protein
LFKIKISIQEDKVMPLNQKLITKISQFSLLSLLTTTTSIVSTPHFQETLAQEYSGCFLINSEGRLVNLNDICPGDAGIAAQQELAKQENPIIMVNGVVEPDSESQNIAYIRMKIKNRSDLPQKIIKVIAEVKDTSFGLPKTLGNVAIYDLMTLEPGQEITVNKRFLISAIGATSNQNLGVDLANVVFLD